MMGIEPTELRRYVIAPALRVIGMGGNDAEELLLGTALQESDCGRHLHQEGAGPALGVWQMEPATHDDIWRNYLLAATRSSLAVVMRSLVFGAIVRSAQLAGNLYYACAMARLVYERVDEKLPAAGDIEAQAAFYKRHYNTAAGAATADAYIAKWRAAFPTNPGAVT
jgi:hypothetical protein